MSLTCFHCGEEVSPEGNVCILCGADKEISTELQGAKMMRGLLTFLVFIFSFALQNPVATIGLTVSTFIAVNKYFDNHFKKSYPKVKIKML